MGWDGMRRDGGLMRPNPRFTAWERRTQLISRLISGASGAPGCRERENGTTGQRDNGTAPLPCGSRRSSRGIPNTGSASSSRRGPWRCRAGPETSWRGWARGRTAGPGTTAVTGIARVQYSHSTTTDQRRPAQAHHSHGTVVWYSTQHSAAAAQPDRVVVGVDRHVLPLLVVRRLIDWSVGGSMGRWVGGSVGRRVGGSGSSVDRSVVGLEQRGLRVTQYIPQRDTGGRR